MAKPADPRRSPGGEAYQAKGGRARAESLSPERRREIAAKAAHARWGASAARSVASRGPGRRAPAPDPRVQVGLRLAPGAVAYLDAVAATLGGSRSRAFEAIASAHDRLLRRLADDAGAGAVDLLARAAASARIDPGLDPDTRVAALVAVARLTLPERAAEIDAAAGRLAGLDPFERGLLLDMAERRAAEAG